MDTAPPPTSSTPEEPGVTRWLSRCLSALGQFKLRWIYPYVRRKDAGYLANVLAEYAGFSPQVRAALPNADEVSRCHESLTKAIDRTSRASGAAADHDPMVSKIWLQTYMRQLFVVEKAVLDMQSFPLLLARAPLLIERFRNTAGRQADYIKREYEQQLSSEKLGTLLTTWNQAGTGDAGAAAAKQAEEWLRSRMRALLNDIHWWYGQSQTREELFLGQQLALILLFLAMALVLGSVHLFACDCRGKVNAMAMLFGVLGAFTSVMRRMRADAEQHGGGSESTYKELTALAYGKIGIAFSLVFGAVFALVLMLLFESGLAGVVFNDKLVAQIFPALPLDFGKAGCSTPGCWLGFTNVASASFAKMLVWSFIAGFAEQFVPDALHRLTKAAEPRKT